MWSVCCARSDVHGVVVDNNAAIDDDIAEDEDEYDENFMEVQPDIIMNEGEEQNEHFDSIVEEEAVDPIQGTS